MIQVAVFDFDGTLVDSNAIKMQAFDDVVANLPGGADALALARLDGGDRYRIFTAVARRLAAEDDAARVAAMGRSLAAEYGRRCRLGIAGAPERRGAAAALRALRRRGLRLYVNSATPRVDLPAVLRARGWSHLFDGVYGAPGGKTESLRAILRRERVPARAAVMVGDSADDLAAAREVGTWFVGVTAESRIALRPPFGMRDLATLAALLDRLAARPRRAAGVARS